MGSLVLGVGIGLAAALIMAGLAVVAALMDTDCFTDRVPPPEYSEAPPAGGSVDAL